jgi:formylglycine-generating enzyme required for sulfatase activity
MLLRPPVLDQAEAWLAFRPGGAPAPTAEAEAFIAQSRKAMLGTQRIWRLVLATTFTFMAATILGLLGWINQAYIEDQWRWWMVTRPYMVSQVRPYVLDPAKERTLSPGSSFKECAQDCPEMIVAPAGSFTMGGRTTEEEPLHLVTVARPFAVSKYELTFADWDACVGGGGCKGYRPYDQRWGRDRQPVINVSWDDAQQYVAWLSLVTGKTYRLLSESEYEYATRAGSTTIYPWGDLVDSDRTIGDLEPAPPAPAPGEPLHDLVLANCFSCGSQWDGKQTAPVGSFPPNKFGLYDMIGNVFEWTEDCYHKNYDSAPTDGSAWREGENGDCDLHVLRAGSWSVGPDQLRSGYRLGQPTAVRDYGFGFRVARTLAP